MTVDNRGPAFLKTDGPRSSPYRDTHWKALSLNLDDSIYGTFAEIGAGQEIARWFLKVGAASGTVAKTICAYDKRVSDEIYGAGTRYVSRERLLAMLSREYTLLLERLGSVRGTTTRFFALADTVATRSYKGDNEQHGWIGVRFQTKPGMAPSQLLLHINLRDATAQLQQQAIGILGVNLLYVAYQQRLTSRTFLTSLFEGLSIRRVEVDVIEFDGPGFNDHDGCGWGLELVIRQMAHAIVINGTGQVVEPSSVLRKRPLLLMRGTFSHPELLDLDVLNSARNRLIAEGQSFECEPVTLREVSVHSLTHLQTPSAQEMIECVRQLSAHGPLIVSDYPETYRLSHYLRRYSKEPVRFVVSVAAASKIMHETFYGRLPGTLLEGLGRLLATNVKLYVAPMRRQAFRAALGENSERESLGESATDLVALDDLILPAPVCHLLAYLKTCGRIVSLDHNCDHWNA